MNTKQIILMFYCTYIIIKQKHQNFKVNNFMCTTINELIEGLKTVVVKMYYLGKNIKYPSIYFIKLQVGLWLFKISGCRSYTRARPVYEMKYMYIYIGLMISIDNLIRLLTRFLLFLSLNINVCLMRSKLIW